MIKIVEVGPRDGLQNERRSISTAEKIRLVDALSQTGVAEIEASAFVSPKWVPQLADAAEVFAGISRRREVVYSALVPNEQGLERALAAGVDKIAVFTAASETFNRHNINASIDESIRRFEPVLRRAKENELPVRGYVSTAFWCPYEGAIEPARTVDVVRMLLDRGVDEISLGDTIGRAVPEEVDAVLDVLKPVLPVHRLAMHFHDTYGRALANVLAAWRRGVETFDSSIGGIGGCPYAPGATGNVATELLARTLRDAGADVRVDFSKLAEARRLILPRLT